MKFVLNKCYGGFRLSPLAVIKYCARKNLDYVYVYARLRSWDGMSDGQGRRYHKLSPISVDLFSRAHYSEDNLYIGPCFYITKGACKAEDMVTSDDLNLFHENGQEFDPSAIPRDDPDLVAVVEELSEAANGQHSKLEVVTLDWYIEERDGYEHLCI